MEPAGKGDEAIRPRKKLGENNDDAIANCPVCGTAFDDTVQRPHALPCGHTFCTPCINGLLQHDQIMCPTCHITHAVPEAGQFPISSITESFTKRVKDAASASQPPTPEKDKGEPTPSPGTGDSQKGPEEFSKAIRSLLQEQENNLLNIILLCQTVQINIEHNQKKLADWGQTQQSLEDRLQALMDQSKGARMLIRQEESKMADKKEKVQHGEQQLDALVQTLRTVETRQKALEVIYNAERGTDDVKQKCGTAYLDETTVTTVKKVREESRAALEAVETVQAARNSTTRDSLLLLLLPILLQLCYILYYY